jgi:hypothetical protein
MLLAVQPRSLTLTSVIPGKSVSLRTGSGTGLWLSDGQNRLANRLANPRKSKTTVHTRVPARHVLVHILTATAV